MTGRSRAGDAFQVVMSLSVQGSSVYDAPGGRGVLVRDGRIASLSADTPPDTRQVRLERGLIAPGFVEPHLHLDKAFLLDRLPPSIGSLQAAIVATAALKRQFTREDILQRAEHVLRLALGHGTLYARVHAEIDPVLRLTSLEAMLELRERWRERIQLQVVAFPQDGIFCQPGTLELLSEGLRMGADVIGGCPYVDPDPAAHVDAVFAMARRFGVPADFHIDFADDASQPIVSPYVAERTIAEGMQGRVVLGHVTALGSLPLDKAKRIAEQMAEARLHVVSLPATDLHMGGRGDATRVRRGLTPAKLLLRAGVNVAIASNNVCNAFTPYGNADPLEIAQLMMVGAHL
ncbi:MAG: amidohydrolase family protein, partial [Chloroflexi bacterium]|nr:amidohydrolase family protein [Chloroflexota bacterium]